ncbi:hypothetical protein [Herbaspirillum seropedicae]|uniref:hypothetical protein n=1 Tax=Herbaspirillum seropedicae TaxID=964 RepID=UPI00285987D4|nr:hypothetical protein [Herbaspirillum seropedicae]MDR6394664.1 hypothetical protein [Herbaspirillum seropedicae]
MADSFDDARKTETYKSMITISIEVFKLLVLINGGAAAGMIAAMQSILKVIDHTAFQRSLTLFVVGLVASSIAICFSWVTQYILHQENTNRAKYGRHRTPMRCSICACAVSLFSFGLGAILAATAIHATPPCPGV